MKEVTFIGWFKNDNMFTKEIKMQESDIAWSTRGFAEVNSAKVHAIVDDKIVCTEDCRG